MQRFALIALFVVSPAWPDAPAVPPPPPTDGPIIRIVPQTLTGKVGDLIVIKAETSAKLVTWDVAGEQKDTAKLLYPRPYDPAHKTVNFHASKDGVYAVAGSIPNGEETRVDIVIITIGPRPPPPDPKPDPPKPDPPKPDPPIPSPTEPVAFLIFIEESSESTANRGAMISDKALAARLREKGIKWRAADQNVTDPQGNRPRDLVPYLDKAKGKKLPQVFLVGATSKLLHQGDFQGGAVELLTLLAKFGG